VTTQITHFILAVLLPSSVLMMAACAPTEPGVDVDSGSDEETPCEESVWFADADEDGFGDADAGVAACDPPEGFVVDATDCDDGNAAVYVDAIEDCDGVDNDCDGEVDEGVEGGTWYSDQDGDGFGDGDAPVVACQQPTGTVETGDDCDDSDAAVFPGAEDVCDGVDNDCDGDVDGTLPKLDWILVTLSGNTIHRIDRATGEKSVLSTLVQSIGASAIEARADGTTVAFTNSGHVLYEIDVCTGDVDEIGTTGAGDMGGVSFGRDGALYALDSDVDALFELDTESGQATEVGDLGFDLRYSGLTWDCATDTLYGVDGTLDQVFTVDAETGATSQFTDTASFGVVGLDFDAARGVIVASTGSTLIEMDPVTGEYEEMGSLASANNLALVPPCE
jgi:hypothetical protein